MSVATDVSLQAVLSDLVLVAAYADAAGLTLDIGPLSEQNLRFYVAFPQPRRRAVCCGIRLRGVPASSGRPSSSFNAHRTQRGTRDLYPEGFHPTPCICMRYNERLTASVGGPHGDWRLLDWRLPTVERHRDRYLGADR
jgi:hypothetical protein